jgi:hypothetical protein
MPAFLRELVRPQCFDVDVELELVLAAERPLGELGVPRLLGGLLSELGEVRLAVGSLLALAAHAVDRDLDLHVVVVDFDGRLGPAGVAIAAGASTKAIGTTRKNRSLPVIRASGTAITLGRRRQGR